MSAANSLLPWNGQINLPSNDAERVALAGQAMRAKSGQPSCSRLSGDREEERAMSVLDGIGNTPLVALEKVVPRGSARVLAKLLEWANPTGSMKDRMALAAIQAAERDGRLSQDRGDRYRFHPPALGTAEGGPDPAGLDGRGEGDGATPRSRGRTIRRNLIRGERRGCAQAGGEARAGSNGGYDHLRLGAALPQYRCLPKHSSRHLASIPSVRRSRSRANERGCCLSSTQTYDTFATGQSRP